MAARGPFRAAPRTGFASLIPGSGIIVMASEKLASVVAS
jgi:hypothetical protein